MIEGVTEEKLKYCLYARKSTESDERQALSIDSQVKDEVSWLEPETSCRTIISSNLAYCIRSRTIGSTY